MASAVENFFRGTYWTVGAVSLSMQLKRCAAFLLLTVLANPSWAMEMKVEGNQLVLSGSVDGLELTKFSGLLAPAIKTIVFSDSSGGDFESGLNLAAIIRQRGLTTVAKGFCRSSCANAFLGGVNRYLANSRSYVAFHGHYNRRSTTLQSRIGEMRTFYAEMTAGKVSDELVQLWMQKPRAGMVYFFRSVTYSCDGTESKRPSGCEKLPQTAMDQGIITSLDDR